MLKTIAGTASLALFAAVLGTVSGPWIAPSAAMSAYKWKSRPLLIFAPSSKVSEFDRQKSTVTANMAGFRERDMVVIYVAGGSVTTALGREPGRSAQALRAAYGVNNGEFRTILVGKDGGAKLRSSKPVSAYRLFGLFDSMPMRQQEMQERG